MEEWKKRDPILHFRTYLEVEGLLTPAAIEQMEAQVHEEVEDAVAFATNAPYPDVASATWPVYAEDVRHEA